MQIKCPECQNVLSIGQPKAGNYKPKCKNCGKPFRIKITSDTPPKIAIGRIKPAAPQQNASKAKPIAPKVNAPKTDATMDSVVPDQATQVDATMDSVVPDQATQVDATMDSVVPGQVTQVDATMDSSPRHRQSRSKTVVSTGKAKSGSKSISNAGEIPQQLGGYRILRLLGRGAMGDVYEAKQTSLDRLVAIKTIRAKFANHPASLARFTREAYAAAQLTHHNVVQIYDFGEDDGRHFFSMEWVRGGPLDELVKKKGALDPKLAGGYVLQAARGLQFAHLNGMVHRDVKPANLLLSDDGVVKVADLGLVKIPDMADIESDVEASGIPGMQSGTQVTMQGTAVGTPAYMAPEQGADAARVDHRADIYSLGCTLFYLLAGKSPFGGTMVSEVLEQHAKAALPDIREINTRVPAALQQIIGRSMAKRPDDRYASLAEMITELESFQGIHQEGSFSPTSEQADRWEAIAKRHGSATAMMKFTKPALAGILALGLLLTLVLPFAGIGWLLLGPTLAIAAIATALILGAHFGKSAVIDRVRQWIGCLGWMDYGVVVVQALVLLLVVSIAGLWIGVFLGGIMGAIAGVAYHFAIVAPSSKKGTVAIDEAEKFVRDLRIDGADEEGIRNFTARYAGKKWQGLFESLFGYDSLCDIRNRLSSDPSFSASTASNSLRDKICHRLADKVSTVRQQRDQNQLAKIEQRGLQSEGVSAAEARERAEQIAAAVMDNAHAAAPAQMDAQAAVEAKRERMKTMMAEARSGKYKKPRDKMAPIKWALGGKTRLLAGCLLLAVFAIWGNANGLFDSLKEIDLQSLSDLDSMGSALDSASDSASQLNASTAVLGSDTSAWSIGIAGLLLMMSAFLSGWRMTPFAMVATMVILFGPSLGIPGVGNLLQPWMVSGFAGLVIYLPGIFLGEAKEY